MILNADRGDWGKIRNYIRMYVFLAGILFIIYIVNLKDVLNIPKNNIFYTRGKNNDWPNYAIKSFIVVLLIAHVAVPAYYKSIKIQSVTVSCGCRETDGYVINLLASTQSNRESVSSFTYVYKFANTYIRALLA